MEKEVFITKIKHNSIFYSVFLKNDKYIIKSDGKVIENDLSKKIVKMIYDQNRIKNVLKYKNKNLSVSELSKLAGFILGSGILLTSISKNEESVGKDLNKEKEISTIHLENQAYLPINEELLINYNHAIYTNPNLSLEDKKILAQRYEYVEKNQKYINLPFLYKMLNEVKINRLSWCYENISGEFVLNDENKPFITLYNNANDETLIHEIYHLLHHNIHYWDTTYFYDGKFIGSDEYFLLSNENKTKCEKVPVLGNFLEEAYTTINTCEEENTNNIPVIYSKELYIYKIYENILGKENMTKNMFSANQVKGFLNLLLENGMTKEEAIAMTARLDLFNTYTIQKEKENIEVLEYQLCDDLFTLYQKKFGKIDNILLNCTALSVYNGQNIDNIYINLEETKSDDLKKLMKFESFSLKDYTPDNIYFSEDISKVEIDYFSEENPIVYFTLDNKSVLKFKINNNNLEFQSIENQETIDNNDLYNDYYTFAFNKYNDVQYADYFACIYANTNINVDEKADLLNYYEEYTYIISEKTLENLDLMNDDYITIINFIKNNQRSIKR